MNYRNILFFITGLLFAPWCLGAQPIPKAPDIAARSYIIQDFDSGQVIAEKGMDDRVEPASITKLMTAYVVFNELRNNSFKLDDKVRISEKAWRTPGSRMFVEVDTMVPVSDLLRGMIIQSGNDATVALAEKVAGTEESFANLMNHHAKELGMTGSHFVNSTGLPDPEHYTTARDIANLTRVLINEFPEYYKLYSQREFTYGGITQHNRNKLLWRDETVDGVKTGHTESAGYCLVTSAKRENMRLITVVLGTGSEEARADASESLLNYGFHFFETHKLYDAGSKLSSARVWKGASGDVDLGVKTPLFITVPRGRYNDLNASMQIGEQIMAPIGAGAALGRVIIRLDDKTLLERDLVALNEVPEGSMWQRLVDEALLYFQ